MMIKAIYALLLFYLFMKTDAFFVKKAIGVSHADTVIALRLELYDKNNDLKVDLNDQNSDNFQTRGTVLCYFLSGLFLQSNNVDSYNKFENCNVDRFHITRENGVTKEAAVDITLRFEGRDFDRTLEYIQEILYNRLNRDVSTGRVLYRIGDFYISRYWMTDSIKIVFNTHEMKSPLLGGNERKRNMDKLFGLTGRGFHESEFLRSNVDFGRSFDQGHIVNVMSAKEANERLSQLKLRLKQRNNRVQQRLDLRDIEQKIRSLNM